MSQRLPVLQYGAEEKGRHIEREASETYWHAQDGSDDKGQKSIDQETGGQCNTNTRHEWWRVNLTRSLLVPGFIVIATVGDTQKQEPYQVPAL